MLLAELPISPTSSTSSASSASSCYSYHRFVLGGRDPIAGRTELHGSSLTEIDAANRDLLLPHYNSPHDRDQFTTAIRPTMEQNAPFPQPPCSASQIVDYLGSSFISASSTEEGQDDMAEELSTASNASFNVFRNHLLPSSSAPRFACEITTKNWSRERVSPQDALKIRTRTSSTYDDLPNRLARAFSSLHGADMEKQTAVKLELEALLLDYEHFGVSCRDPLLFGDLRRVLTSLDVNSRKRLCQASTDDNETKSSLGRDFQMAHDPEPVAEDTSPCLRKLPPISTSSIARAPSTAIEQKALAAHDLLRNSSERPDNQSQKCQDKAEDGTKVECSGPCEIVTRCSHRLKDHVAYSKRKSTIRSSQVLAGKDDRAVCISASDQLALSFTLRSSARLSPKPGTSVRTQDECTDIDAVVTPTSLQRLSLAFTRLKEAAISEISMQMPRPFSFSKGDDAQFAGLSRTHTKTSVDEPDIHDNALPRPPSQQNALTCSPVQAIPGPRYLAIDPPCSGGDKHVDSVMSLFSERARMLMWNLSSRTMVGRISVDSIVANFRSAIPPDTRIADSTISQVMDR